MSLKRWARLFTKSRTGTHCRRGRIFAISWSGVARRIPDSGCATSEMSAGSSVAADPGGAVRNSVTPAAIGPCAGGQLVISGKSLGAAMMHRGVQLTFALARGAASCTLQGYPGVDTGAGGPATSALVVATIGVPVWWHVRFVG